VINMLKTKINLKAELPYSIELSNNGNIVYGAGKTPATATMAALSVAKMIPSGLRDNMEAARIIFWDYKSSHNWARLIHILTEDTFDTDPICGDCKKYNSDTCFCDKHPEYGELVEQDTCSDWSEDE